MSPRLANVATLKKGGKVLLDAPVISADGWELAHTCKTWEDADRFRTAIVRESNRSARVRYAQPNFLVEWKS